ncbi:MAG: lysozyme [Pseudomonadota bacterium]
MKISLNGIALIKRFEGLELESYQDIAGIWTIGYGHTETAGPDQRITEDEAEQLLRQDLGPREQAVSRLSNVPLNQNEFDALVSFVYNVGQSAYRRSTARRRLNAGDRIGAAEALTWFNKATVGGVLVPVTGLTRRRAAERALFLTPTEPLRSRDENAINENSRVQPVEDPPRRGNIGESRTLQGAAVAGGAGVAASNMGRNSATQLNDVETDIEDGQISLDPSKVDETGDNLTDNNEPNTDGDQETSTIDDGADNDVRDGNTTTDGDIVENEELSELTEEQDYVPSRHENNMADAQIQLALTILIILAVVYIIYARIEDWFRYRR